MRCKFYLSFFLGLQRAKNKKDVTLHKLQIQRKIRKKKLLHIMNINEELHLAELFNMFKRHENSILDLWKCCLLI